MTLKGQPSLSQQHKGFSELEPCCFSPTRIKEQADALDLVASVWGAGSVSTQTAHPVSRGRAGRGLS